MIYSGGELGVKFAVCQMIGGELLAASLRWLVLKGLMMSVCLSVILD